MEKKEYIAPLTETSLMVVEQHMMKTSFEQGIDPGNSDSKGNDIAWDNFDNDLWGEEDEDF